MLGLRRNTIELAAHDPCWIEFGKCECERLGRTAGGLLLDVQHVGSTAVRGLPAKPILDIAGGVATEDVLSCLIQKFASLDIVYRGDRRDNGGYLFIRESEPNVRVLHLHIIKIEDPQWLNYLRFRDILGENEMLRRRYAELKKALAQKFEHRRNLYTAAKHDFIQQTLNQGVSPSTREDDL